MHLRLRVWQSAPYWMADSDRPYNERCFRLATAAQPASATVRKNVINLMNLSLSMAYLFINKPNEPHKSFRSTEPTNLHISPATKTSLMASIEYRKLHFICILHNGRLLVFAANFCIFRQNTFNGSCMWNVGGIFLRHNRVWYSRWVGWGVGVGVSAFGSMWIIRQVIRSLRNFHWKVFLGLCCVPAIGCLCSYLL